MHTFDTLLILTIKFILVLVFTFSNKRHCTCLGTADFSGSILTTFAGLLMYH